jgi:hypothetical protein
VLDADGVPAALARAAALGYTHVELRGVADRPADHLDALADSGLLVAGVELAAAGPGAAALERQIADAARLGAAVVLVDPAPFAAPPAQVIDLLVQLADFAAGRMMPLCIAGSPPAHPNLRPWLRLRIEDAISPAAGPMPGSVRISGPATGRWRAVLQAVRQLGFPGPVAVRPQPVVGPRPLLEGECA